MDQLCLWTCFWKMPNVSLHLLKTNWMKLSRPNPRYCFFISLSINVAATKWWKLRLNISKIKPFDVELEHIIHFKTAEVHFNETFGEYQILIYRYFSKILQNIEIVFTKHFVWVGLLQPLQEYYYQLFQKFFQQVIYLVLKMRYRINCSSWTTLTWLN